MLVDWEISQGRIAGYRIGEEQSAGVRRQVSEQTPVGRAMRRSYATTRSSANTRYPLRVGTAKTSAVSRAAQRDRRFA
jgi:hypothetical protein